MPGMSLTRRYRPRRLDEILIHQSGNISGNNPGVVFFDRNSGIFSVPFLLEHGQKVVLECVQFVPLCRVFVREDGPRRGRRGWYGP